MLARNSLLYLEVRASCSAFSSSSCLASSISRFLPSTCDFCVAELPRLGLQLLVGLLELVLLLLEQLLGLLERGGLLLQAGVGLAQLLLLALQLLGQRLRLRQQRPRSACWPRSC